MKGAHYRVRNMSRAHFTLFVFAICLSIFGLGLGILAADAEVGRVSAITTSTFVPTTTTTQVTRTTAIPAEKHRLLRVDPQKNEGLASTTQIGTALSIVREPTTTTPEPPKTPLEVAQAEVGTTGPYADGGFWCAKFQSWLAEQAKVEGFEQSDSPARLYAVAKEQGRLTDTPQPGYLVFIDLTGQNNANDYISHVGIVESVDGEVIHTIEGNADKSGLVTRQTRRIGDGFVVDFASFDKAGS
jgi:hypothetical protein